ncbi:MAG: 3-phosphoglycerate dehydrogenase [Proteobacteria bacterium]|nr:3-phosphoglycerate dehydrogenase [Pseudomonadota bacterium]MCP4917004.1 3-phosphoglycerate dehydrogenase [Pseudomonadota bacterium]
MARIVTGPLTRAVVVEDPHADLDGLLLAGGFTSVVRLPAAPPQDELIAALVDNRAQVLFKRSRVPVTRAVIEAAPDLVSIQLCCIGDDSIDKEACAEHGVLVFNDPISNGRSVVELALGHLVGLSRRLYETYDDTNDRIWEKNNRERYEVRGKVLGIVGLGNIGRATARLAEQFGMRVLFHDSREVAQEIGSEMGWSSQPTIEAVFRNSDFVSLHMSAVDSQGASNAGCITRDILFSLGADRPENSPRLFLNLSRGFLHDPQDLLDAVAAGRVRRAAVDVYPVEPRKNGPGWDNPYADEPRIATTPHIGAATQEAQPRIARRVSATTLAFSQHGSIRDCVFSPRTKIDVADGHRDGRAVLVVVHATTRGTKKALDDAIYEAGSDNLRSTHRDFSRWDVAVDVSLLDRPLSDAGLKRILERTRELTGEQDAVRLVRQISA